MLIALINSLNHFNIFINVFSKFFPETDLKKKKALIMKGTRDNYDVTSSMSRVHVKVNTL